MATERRRAMNAERAAFTDFMKSCDRLQSIEDKKSYRPLTDD